MAKQPHRSKAWFAVGRRGVIIMNQPTLQVMTIEQELLTRNLAALGIEFSVAKRFVLTVSEVDKEKMNRELKVLENIYLKLLGEKYTDIQIDLNPEYVSQVIKVLYIFLKSHSEPVMLTIQPC